jgi:hypothetical protein
MWTLSFRTHARSTDFLQTSKALKGEKVCYILSEDETPSSVALPQYISTLELVHGVMQIIRVPPASVRET